jgi:alkanesulfonate monooxygenase SsuD/methylene tetrahydromethanopterin reductase-like flavin-dependent oxidoreductase (luciferase family)
MAAALSRRSDAALIIMGASLALYNPPIRVAEEFAMLDFISGGRLVAGFPRHHGCYAYGQNEHAAAARKHDLILRAWTGAFTFHGRWNQLRYVNVWPRPSLKPHPPIWIPGGGSGRNLALVRERDPVTATYTSATPRAPRPCAAAGRIKRLGGRNPYARVSCSSSASPDARGSHEALPRACRVLRPLPASRSALRPPPGYMTEGSMTKAESMAPPRAGGADHAMTFDRIVDGGHVIVGSPEEVAAKLRGSRRRAERRADVALCQFGNMSRELAGYNIELFAKRVAPELRGVRRSLGESLVAEAARR